MARDRHEAREIVKALERSPAKLTLAHYRRKMPAFVKVKEFLDQKAIGAIRLVDIEILQPKNSGIIAGTEANWRLDPAISGGGYFHDLAPHQIDLMAHYLGDFLEAKGLSSPREVPNLVSGIGYLGGGIPFRGVWAFHVSPIDQNDRCTLYGSEGSLEFSFYGDVVSWKREGGTEVFRFPVLEHVQQPMIEATVAYFLGRGPNPCSAKEGLAGMEVMDAFSGK